METRSITEVARKGPRLSEDPSELVPELAEVSAALFRAVGNGSVPRITISLVHLRAGQTRATEEQITSVASCWDSPYFDAAERAAPALVEAVLQPSADGERVSDELFALAAGHYEPKALTTLMNAVGQVGFFLAIALIAKPAPGRSFTEPWR